MNVEGSNIRVKFDYVGGGLAARGGKPLDWFKIAGEDRKFVDAVAKIDGDSITVSSKTVEKPVAVRFGWDQVAEPNLANIEGLPASAFRTDRW
jgi:sialate O-acetylesterase